MLARRRFSFPRLVRYVGLLIHVPSLYITQALSRMSAIGTYGFGVPIGFALGYGRLWNADNTAIQDRAFRLRNSASQVSLPNSITSQK